MDVRRVSECTLRVCTRRVLFVGTTCVAVWLSRAFLQPSGAVPNHPAVVESAWVATLLWFLGIFAHLRCHRTVTVPVWATAAAFQLLHVAIAFHSAHGWSHAAAFEHTRKIGGFGEGVFVNYAFTLLWCVDAIWLCCDFENYRHRPRWLSWAIHGFMAFIVFNAAVVFGSWTARGVFAIGTAIVWYAMSARRGETKTYGGTT